MSFDSNNIIPQKSVSLLAQKVVLVSISQWISSFEKKVQDQLRVIIMMNLLCRGKPVEIVGREYQTNIALYPDVQMISIYVPAKVTSQATSIILDSLT